MVFNIKVITSIAIDPEVKEFIEHKIGNLSNFINNQIREMMSGYSEEQMIQEEIDSIENLLDKKKNSLEVVKQQKVEREKRLQQLEADKDKQEEVKDKKDYEIALSLLSEFDQTKINKLDLKDKQQVYNMFAEMNEVYHIKNPERMGRLKFTSFTKALEFIIKNDVKK